MKDQNSNEATVIEVKAVYDEEKLTNIARNAAKTKYEVMASWPLRLNFFMDLKALGMGFLEAISERDSARAEQFKSYVHQRLDKMGVPANPEPATHALEGCRVGDRLDWVANQMPLCTSPVERRRIDNLEKSNESMKTRLHATRMTLAGLVDELSAATQQKT